MTTITIKREDLPRGTFYSVWIDGRRHSRYRKLEQARSDAKFIQRSYEMARPDEPILGSFNYMSRKLS